ncbi:Uncharacterized protein OS=Acinetobacter baumannii D1279779 GN=ABD1_11230 PE=4 SV=1 [Gemmata massiliana]|uniref:AAA+ ATPase domain-containing protein n=1 Tax=Gemmata massiliana TaxID=1210884 RepID=A0A6P2D538_9BACT|nr:AAA family ATPase [Gemmata massiliana]VTR96017.1 Uncharacterized protein OS=Acinetobacter baumannii D1279779 GN=ABD1_11230 PE=4 SV=1 [Gemmata massiliana]
MSVFEVRKAKRQRRPLKIALEGLSGSGKTFTALRLAFALKRAGIGSRIVVADSENESAGLYDGVQMDGEKWEYEVCPIPADKHTPKGYTECYEFLVKAGFDIIIFDSLSHAWHGAMESVDKYAQQNKGDKFGGWAKVTPDQRKMLTALTDPRAHMIATMRVKSEYERIDDSGKARIKKVGMKTDQRENTEYEFDCVVRLEPESHTAHVEKVRGCTAMDGATGEHPGPEFWQPLMTWWLSAEAVPPPPPPAPAQPPVTPLSTAPAEDAARKAFAAAKNLDQLLAAWNGLPNHIREKVEKDKDARKAVLSAPAPVTSKVGADGVERDELGARIFANGAPPDVDQTELFENSSGGPPR